MRAGFRFDVPVRFAEDRLSLSRATFAAGEIPSVPLIEIRESDVPTSSTGTSPPSPCAGGWSGGTGSRSASPRHDRDLAIGGLVYRAAPGMLPSAISLSDGFDARHARRQGRADQRCDQRRGPRAPGAGTARRCTCSWPTGRRRTARRLRGRARRAGRGLGQRRRLRGRAARADRLARRGRWSSRPRPNAAPGSATGDAGSTWRRGCGSTRIAALVAEDVVDVDGGGAPATPTAMAGCAGSAAPIAGSTARSWPRRTPADAARAAALRARGRRPRRDQRGLRQDASRPAPGGSPMREFPGRAASAGDRPADPLSRGLAAPTIKRCRAPFDPPATGRAMHEGERRCGCELALDLFCSAWGRAPPFRGDPGPRPDRRRRQHDRAQEEAGPADAPAAGARTRGAGADEPAR